MKLHITGHNYLPICGEQDTKLDLSSAFSIEKCKECYKIDKKRDKSSQMGAEDPFFSDGLTTENIKSLKIFYKF